MLLTLSVLEAWLTSRRFQLGCVEGPRGRTWPLPAFAPGCRAPALAVVLKGRGAWGSCPGPVGNLLLLGAAGRPDGCLVVGVWGTAVSPSL